MLRSIMTVLRSTFWMMIAEYKCTMIQLAFNEGPGDGNRWLKLEGFQECSSIIWVKIVAWAMRNVILMGWLKVRPERLIGSFMLKRIVILPDIELLSVS